MTKSQIAFQLFAIYTESEASDAADMPADVRKEAALFAAGKAPAAKLDDLTTMLDAIVADVGEDVAKERVAFRVAFDNLTRAAEIGVDYVKTFGKDVVLSWLFDRDVKHPKRISVAKLNDLTAATKVASFDDVPDHEANAESNVEAEKAEKDAATEAAVESGRAAATTTTAPKSRALTISEPVAISVVFDGKTTTGIMNVDATITFDAKQENGNADVAGKTFKNPSAAAAAAMDKRANGWLQVLYMDGETLTPVDALRVDPKGYARAGKGRKSKAPQTAESLGDLIVKLEARVRRYDEQLTKAKAKLAEAKTDLAANAAVETKKAEIAPTPAAAGPGNEALEVVRRTELAGMKKKQLATIAKSLNVKGRSSMKTDALVDAILAAEIVAVAA